MTRRRSIPMAASEAISRIFVAGVASLGILVVAVILDRPAPLTGTAIAASAWATGYAMATAKILLGMHKPKKEAHP